MARIAFGESASAFCLQLAPGTGLVRKTHQRPPLSQLGIFTGRPGVMAHCPAPVGGLRTKSKPHGVVSPAPFDVYVATLDEAGIFQSLDKSGQPSGDRIRRRAAQNTDHPSRL